MADFYWSDPVSESGVVHEDVANTDYDLDNVLRQGYSIQNPTPSGSLRFYYPFQEDSGTTLYNFGSGTNATLDSGSINDDAFLGTSSVYLGGTDTISTGVSVDALDTSSGLTILCWAKLDTASGGSAMFDYFDGTRQWGLYVSSDDAAWFTYDNSAGATGETYGINGVSTPVQSTTWTCIGVRYDPNEGYGYWVNGTQAASSSQTTWAAPSGPMEFNNQSNSYYQFNGNLWGFRLYEAVLSDSQMQSYYDSIASGGQLTTGFKSV